ncbi:MAG: hypothetical protein M9920_01725 [Verrucomicrobiae bacterium]|nr:hypothetical protein [Verrucomicrobiae bacterium]
MKTAWRTLTGKIIALIAVTGWLGMSAGTRAAAQENLIVNGEFLANAGDFVSWPGVLNHESNPDQINNWANYYGTTIGLNGLGTAIGEGRDVFGPAFPGAQTYALLQHIGMLSQPLGGKYLPDQQYELSFDVAGRVTNPEGIAFWVRIAERDPLSEGGAVHVDSQILPTDSVQFVHYRFTFTAPASFAETPSIQLINPNQTEDDNTVCFANVKLVALPTPVYTNLLTDNFDTADTDDLNADLETRESGIFAPVSEWMTYGNSLADIPGYGITNGSVHLRRIDDTGNFIQVISPMMDFTGDFRLECDVTQTAPPETDSWLAVTVCGNGPVSSAAGGNNFSLLLRPNGQYILFDVSNAVGIGQLPPSWAENYHVRIEVQSNVIRLYVNDQPLSFGNGLDPNAGHNPTDGHHAYALSGAVSGHRYISFVNYAAATAVPALFTLDNLVVSQVPAPEKPDLAATEVLADSFSSEDSENLNNDLAERQTGVAATSSWTATGAGTSAVLVDNALLISNFGDTSEEAIGGMAYLANDLAPYERNRSFQVAVDISPVVTEGDSWGAIKVRQPANLSRWILASSGVSVFVRPNGTWGMSDGAEVVATGAITPATTYRVLIEVFTNLTYLTINDQAVLEGFTINSTEPYNYVSLISNAGPGSSGAAAAFTNFKFDTLGDLPRILPPQLSNPTYAAGEISFQFDSRQNVIYVVEYRDDLPGGDWLPLSNVVGNGATVTVTDATGTAQRFYRVRAVAGELAAE